MMLEASIRGSDMSRQEYIEMYRAGMAALEDGVKRPKLIIGKTKASSRSVSADHSQPVGERSTKWGM